MAAPSSTTNVMLSISEKKTVSVDLYRPLRNYIIYNYSEREAQNIEDDLQTLKEYRSDIERAGSTDSSSSLPARRDLLQNYYKALCAVESRFPISPDQDHINSVTFTWFDAFKNKNKAAQQNIHLGMLFLQFCEIGFENCIFVHCTIGDAQGTTFYCYILALSF